MINYFVLKQDEVEENHVDDCFRSPEKSADFRPEKSADFRFEQKPKKLSKRPRRTKRQQQIDTQHQNTQEVEPNLSQQTGDCQCYYCGEMVAYKVIQDHMKSAHGRFHRKMYGEPRPLQCQVCKATFEKQSALTTHRYHLYTMSAHFWTFSIPPTNYVWINTTIKSPPWSREGALRL